MKILLIATLALSTAAFANSTSSIYKSSSKTTTTEPSAATRSDSVRPVNDTKLETDKEMVRERKIQSMEEREEATSDMGEENKED